MSSQDIYVEIADEQVIEAHISDDEVILVELGDGLPGPKGVGVPPGGIEGDVLYKKSDVDYDTEWGAPADSPGDGSGGSFNGVIGPEGFIWTSTDGTTTFRFQINPAGSIFHTPYVALPSVHFLLEDGGSILLESGGTLLLN